jgi:hypothetical protein
MDQLELAVVPPAFFASYTRYIYQVILMSYGATILS